jgi:phage shock protein PspC (stress-responsive transcriptional regulator)
MTEQQQAQPHESQQQGPPPSGYQGPYQGQYQHPQYRRLTRTSWDAPISGVCGGLGRYFGMDPTLVRVLAVLLAVVTFPAAIIAYAVAWAVMPKE